MNWPSFENIIQYDEEVVGISCVHHSEVLTVIIIFIFQHVETNSDRTS